MEHLKYIHISDIDIYMEHPNINNINPATINFGRPCTEEVKSGGRIVDIIYIR